MSNPNSISAVVPDGKSGVRTIRFVLDDIPSAEWQSLFFRAFDAAATTADPPTVVENSDGGPVFVGDDANSNNTRLFNLVQFSGNEADPMHADYEVVQGWDAGFRRNPRTAISFDGAYMDIKGLDPTKEFTTGKYTTGNNPTLSKKGVVDVVKDVIAAVGLTADTSPPNNYALSLHRTLSVTEGFDRIQGKF